MTETNRYSLFWTCIATGFLAILAAHFYLAITSNPQNLPPGYWPDFAQYLASSFGVLGVTGLAATKAMGDAVVWRAHVRSIGVVAAALNFFVSIIYLFGGYWTPLYRDIVAATVLAYLVTLMAGWLGRLLWGGYFPPIARSLLLLIFSVPAALLVLYVSLAVHCSSGDCL